MEAMEAQEDQITAVVAVVALIPQQAQDQTELLLRAAMVALEHLLL
jgi:hypothetical protein